MRVVLGIVLSVVLATGAWADADAKANKLFVEAVQLWRQAEAVEGENLEQLETRLELLKQINANLDSIVSDYPESNLAVQLMIGPVGGLELDGVDEPIAVLEASIECLREGYQCVYKEALDEARSIEDEFVRSMLLSSIAEALAASGDFAGALEVARSVEDLYERFVALSEILKNLPKEMMQSNP